MCWFHGTTRDKPTTFSTRRKVAPVYTFNPLNMPLHSHRTGPAAQINLMGYARPSQTAHGIHQRLRARAFIIGQRDLETKPQISDNPLESFSATSQARRFLNDQVDQSRTRGLVDLNPDKTVCFVSIDAGMGSDLLNMRVFDRLKELLPSESQPCRLENLSISGTHTHSGPAGYLQYAVYQITSLGFAESVLQAYTEGIAQAIVRAYNRTELGSMEATREWLEGASINRSPTSYLLNPEIERNIYSQEGDTDKSMLQLTFTAQTGQLRGLLNWFAVHPTSMNNSNTLLSGDNKGYASYLAERFWNENSTITGKGEFVAAFASTNLGDVSPNTEGPTCIDTGEPCDMETSTCRGNSHLCQASGPGRNMMESTEINGRMQFEHSLNMLLHPGNNSVPIRNAIVDYRHAFVNLSSVTVSLDDGNVVRTCPPAYGYGFAGGTTDGPAMPQFHQGMNTSNPFWNMVSGFLSIPTPEQVECHAPKPILLNVGHTKLPYPWEPDIVPISIFRAGQFFILNVPAEFTTMAGRRLRSAVYKILMNHGVDNPIVTIAGLSNSYCGYVTTLEEYAGQRYEAASTLYGPYTLSAYIQEFERITGDLLSGSPSSTEASPIDLSRKQLSFIPSVHFDAIGLGKQFGSVLHDANDSYVNGETVAVSFHSANPRNNVRTEGTFLTVEMLDDSGQWQTQFVDSDWCTQYHWKGGMTYWDTSFANIVWEIPNETPRGLYRICHFGTRKTILGNAHEIIWSVFAAIPTFGFGSYAARLSMESLKVAERLSKNLAQSMRDMAFTKTADFQGCSRTFLVY